MASQYTVQATRLLELPREIRDAIYALLIPTQAHVQLRNGVFFLATCLEPRIERGGQSKADIYLDPPNALIRDENDFNFRTKKSTKSLWVPRLRSTWGPHWRCKEAALEGDPQSRFALNLLLVCRAFSIEIMEVLVRTTEFHAANMDVVNYFNHSISMQYTLSSILPTTLQNLTQLSITIRFPLAFYRIMNSSNIASPLSPELAHLKNGWEKLSTSLLRFPRLQILRFWLDHDEPDSWSVVNERALFSHLADVFTKHGLRTYISLPNLHPILENKEFHFTRDMSPPFILQRRMRQRYFSVQSGRESYEIVIKNGFPFLVDIVEYIEDMTMEQLEEVERGWWERGGDVEKEVYETLDITPDHRGFLQSCFEL